MSDHGENHARSNGEAKNPDHLRADVSDSGSRLKQRGSRREGSPDASNGNDDSDRGGQSHSNNVQSSVLRNRDDGNSIRLDKLKLHFSSNDLSKLSDDDCAGKCDSVRANKRSQFTHSNSCNNLLNSEKPWPGQKKYDHIESKVKQYFNARPAKKSIPSPQQRKAVVTSTVAVANETSSGNDYLQEINMRLTKELEEKNALLTMLQENYENLLLKYAEAQNKIDQLRLKSTCESTDCPNHLAPGPTTAFQLPLSVFPHPREQRDTPADVKCQKAVVAPFMKENMQKNDKTVKVDRPCSLPLEPCPKVVERIAIKAGTPTDSEGVSSVKTSMSGHSKILNILEGHSPHGRDSKLMPYPERDFVLQENSAVNDAFDKVKNWQNSLPPLELIETPETTLYDEPGVRLSPSTNYSEDRSSGKDRRTSEDERYSTNRPDITESLPGNHNSDSDSQHRFKEYLRTLSLPSAAKKKNVISMKHQRRNRPPVESFPDANHSGDDPIPSEEKHQNPLPKGDIPSGCIIIQRPRKKPPLLRCSSLPSYDCDSPKSLSCRNVYIPMLNLENLTASDVDSSQVEYDYSKGNRITSSSYITSQSGSMDFSSHTYRSNSFRGRQTDYSDSAHSAARPSFSKSTSISPDRCREMNFQFLAKARMDPRSACRVCGQSIPGDGPSRDFPCRSTSYQNFPEMKDPPPNWTDPRPKHPFHRSVSFNWDADADGKCCHAPRDSCAVHRRSQDSLEKLDVYANNLKARSQVIMKALAAHVNNT